MAASLLMAATSVSILLISTETAIGLQVRSRQADRDYSVASWISSHSAVVQPSTANRLLTVDKAGTPSPSE